MKKLCRFFIFALLSVSFILGCSSENETNDETNTSIQNNNDKNNSNSDLGEKDKKSQNINETEENNDSEKTKKDNAEQSDVNKENTNSEKTEENKKSQSDIDKENTDSENTEEDKKSQSDINQESHDSEKNEENNTSQNKDINENKTDSENTKNNEGDTSKDTDQEENIPEDDKENLEESRILKLYASSIKSTDFNMIGSNTYTLELFGEWSSNDIAILASKIKKAPSECNIILDDTEAIISSGMEFLYNLENLAVKIGKNSFWDFSFSFNLSSIKFRKIIIKDDVTEIPSYTFYRESFETPYLESITIPSSVKNIGYQAFFGCTNLKEVIIEDGDEALELSYNKDGGPALFGEGLFYDCPLENVYIGRNLIYKKDGRYGFSPFEPRRLSSNMKKTIGDNVTSY